MMPFPFMIARNISATSRQATGIAAVLARTARSRSSATFSSKTTAGGTTKKASTTYVRPPTYAEQVRDGVPFGKRKLHGPQHQLAWQAAIALSMLSAFVLSPFLGRRIAEDERLRAFLPSWYDFTVKQPEDAMTREEFHAMMIEMHRELHQRAIRGEFTDDKLREMDWKSESNDQGHGEEVERRTTAAALGSDVSDEAVVELRHLAEPFAIEEEEDDDDDDMSANEDVDGNVSDDGGSK